MPIMSAVFGTALLKNRKKKHKSVRLNDIAMLTVVDVESGSTKLAGWIIAFVGGDVRSVNTCFNQACCFASVCCGRFA